MSWSFVLIWPHLTTFWASQVVLGGKESACRSRRRKRRGFNPWAEKTPWRRAWQPTPICLPGESLCIEEPGGLHTVLRVTESRTRNVRCKSNGADLHLQFEHIGAALQRRILVLLVRFIWCAVSLESQCRKAPRTWLWFPSPSLYKYMLYFREGSQLGPEFFLEGNWKLWLT